MEMLSVDLYVCMSCALTCKACAPVPGDSSMMVRSLSWVDPPRYTGVPKFEIGAVGPPVRYVPLSISPWLTRFTPSFSRYRESTNSLLNWTVYCGVSSASTTPYNDCWGKYRAL